MKPKHKYEIRMDRHVTRVRQKVDSVTRIVPMVLWSLYIDGNCYKLKYPSQQATLKALIKNWDRFERYEAISLAVLG